MMISYHNLDHLLLRKSMMMRHIFTNLLRIDNAKVLTLRFKFFNQEHIPFI